MARSNKQRTEQTRTDLIAAGRALFVEKGYAETATPDIAARAGVTRGALYHHFEDKKALLHAVVEAEAAEVARAIEAAAPAATEPQQELILGGEAFLDAIQRPGRARLLLLDGPAALGMDAMGEIDAEHGGATLHDGLERAAKAGLMAAGQPIGQLAALLSAAYDRAALDINAGADPTQYRQALAQLIAGLFRR